MNEYGEVIEGGAVRFERLLPGPIERVWKYLTDSELRGRWLASGAMDPREGGTVTLFFHHSELTAHAEATPEKYKSMENGITTVEKVTCWEPPRRLAYTWGGGSEVTFDLAPRGEQVLLTLTHRRLPNRDEQINTSAGWHAHLGVLDERLRGEDPRPFWPRVERFEREYPRRIP